MLSIQDYYSDYILKILYAAQTNKFSFNLNSVGVDAGTDIPLSDYTYTDLNSVFVSNDTGDDTTGDGTQVLPYKTLLKGINECTSTLTKVIILDYHIYVEDLSSYSNVYFSGMYTALTADRIYTKYHNVSRIATSADGQHVTTIALDNNKFVIAFADADDTNQGKFLIYDGVNSLQTSLTEFGSIPAVNLQGAKLSNGNFVLTYDGSFVIYDSSGTIVKSETVVNAFANTQYCSVDAFDTGGFLVAYRDTDDSNNGNFAIYDNTGTLTISETTFHGAQTEYIQCQSLTGGLMVIAYRDEDDSDYGKFVVLNSLGVEQVSETQFNNSTTTLYYGAMCELSNGNFLISFINSSSDCYFITYNSSGVNQVSATQVDSGTCSYSASSAMTGYFAIVYSENGATDGNIGLYENDGTVYKAIEAFESYENTFNYVSTLTNGDLVIAYNDAGDTDHTRWNIYTANELSKRTSRLLGYTPADSNSIFVSSSDTLTGDDSFGGTQKSPVLTITQAITLVDGSHQNVVIESGGTFEEAAIEFTGDFLGLYAADGFAPTYKSLASDDRTDYTEAAEVVSSTLFEDGTGLSGVRTITLNNGNWVCCYSDVADSGKGKFVIYTEDGVEVIGPKEFESGDTDYISITVLTNGNWVCCYSDSSNGGKGKFVIYTETGDEVVGPTEFEGDDTGYTSVITLDNGNWVCCYGNADDADGQFVIHDEDGVNVTGPTQFEGNGTSWTSLALLLNGNWVCCYRDVGNNDGRFVIHDEDGVNVTGPTQFEGGTTIHISVATLKNGNWVCCYQDSTAADGKFVIYTQAGVNVTGPTQFESGRSTYCSVVVLENSSWMCSYSDDGDSDKLKFVVHNQSGTQKIAPTVADESATDNPSCTILDNGNVVIAYEDAGTDGKFVIWYPYSWSGLTVSSASNLNGIDLDGNDSNQLTKLIKVNSAKPTIKWCELKKTTNPSTTSIDGYAIYGDNETDIYNSKVCDNDKGIYLTSGVDDFLSHNNIFYRNTGGAAINIDGAAASSGDITIEHNTIFQNGSGIVLENNNGTNEVLKNNIIYEGSTIIADTEVTISYSVLVGVYTNVAFGTSLVRNNPLFINEGAIDPDDINLNIKLRILGYSTNSPALDLADDSRNSGAYNVSTIGSETTWTEIELPKPLSLRADVRFTGARKSISRNGKVSSKKSGQSVYMAFQWRGLGKTYLENLDQLLGQNDPEIQLYLRPVTSEDTYELWNILWDNSLMLSPKLWLHSDEGAEDVKLLIARSYEII